MARPAGRPQKTDQPAVNRETIIQAAVEIIAAEGYETITVRKICAKAEISTGTFYYYFKNKYDLLMFFIQNQSFEDLVLKEDLANLADRITELYMHLIDQYIKFGKKFMRSFYNPNNKFLADYMGEVDGQFAKNTIMNRCEKELESAKLAGYLQQDVNTHEMSADICTIIKGCIFEWCLDDHAKDIHLIIQRILKAYFS